MQDPADEAAEAAAADGDAAAAVVARLLTSLITRHTPALGGAPAAAPRAAAAAPSPHAAPLLATTREAVWLLSHLLPDLAPLTAAAAPPAAAAALLAALTDAGAPSGERVHAVYSRLQHAAAALFDARLAVAGWRSHFDGAAAALGRHAAACGRALGAAVDGALREAQAWSYGAVAHSHTLLDGLGSGVLSLEAARAGRVWSPGAAPLFMLCFRPRWLRVRRAVPRGGARRPRLEPRCGATLHAFLLSSVA